jgi:hypothetical protein
MFGFQFPPFYHSCHYFSPAYEIKWEGSLFRKKIEKRKKKKKKGG